MNNQEVHIQVKNVYGNELIYPVCENARTFAAIANTKTLSVRDINMIRKLGYVVVHMFKGVRVTGLELPAAN